MEVHATPARRRGRAAVTMSSVLGALVLASCSLSTDSSDTPRDKASSASASASRLGTRHPQIISVQSPTPIRKFITALPGLGPDAANEIGQYVPLATKHTSTVFGKETDEYDLVVTEFKQRMHPDLPGETRFWGYSDDDNTTSAAGDRNPRAHAKKYLGGAIVARRGTPVLLKVRNALPNHPLVPVDLGLPAGDGVFVKDLPFNRIATHLHGGFTPWFSDGTPFQWYSPTGLHGESFMNVPGFDVNAGTATYYYPNDQSARMLWYHDHAMGLTRTNAYSGIASAYLMTDDFEGSLIADGTLPGLGTPLVIQDKGFVPPNIRAIDSSWRWGQPGDLWYPHIYPGEPEGTASPTPLPNPSVVPEAFFDTSLVNGGIYPVLRVTDHRVRFRILNASQARFWHLNLFAESESSPGEADLEQPGPAMIQIGNEAGFLPAWTTHSNGRLMPMREAYPESVADPAGPFNLLLAPAERADVIVDFAAWAGRSLVLYNDAPAPFPSGDPANDYFTGNLDLSAEGGPPTTRAGYGPNTRTIMRIAVDAGSPDNVSTNTVLTQLSTQLARAYADGIQPPKLYTPSAARSNSPTYNGPVHRRVTLNEGFDAHGRLLQTLGTLGSDGKPVPLMYMDPSTENPVRGAVEVWQIYNLTADTHPIHFHLVNVQVIERAAFDEDNPNHVIAGSQRAPDPNELGWKETVRANPGEVTTVIAAFNLPTLPAAMGDPVSPRTGGHEYVWHCHILEHEEHDMMRPLIVQ